MGNNEQERKMNGGMVGVIYVAAFVDLFSVSMIIALLPSYLREESGLGLSATEAGILTSIYGLVQFFSSPLVGGIGDGRGYGRVLGVCCLLCSGAYALLGWRTVAAVVASRALAGAFKHTQNLSRTIVAAQADEKAKAVAYGRLNAIGNVGFAIGPAVGSWLIHMWSYNGVFAFTSISFLFNALFIHSYFPRDASASKVPGEEKEEGRRGVWAELKALDWSRHWDVMLIRLCMAGTALLYRSSFNWLLKDRWELGAEAAGYLTSYQGILAFLASFYAHRMTSCYAEKSRCLLHVILLLCLTYVGFLSSTFLAWYSMWLGVFVVATSLLRVLVLEATLDRCWESERGLLVGVSASVVSVARALAPAVAGVLHDLHYQAPTLAGLLISLLAAVVAWRVTPAKHRLHTTKPASS